jgi:hypothetical protein
MLSGRCLNVKGDRDGHPPRLAGARAASRLGLRIRRRSNWPSYPHTRRRGQFRTDGIADSPRASRRAPGQCSRRYRVVDSAPPVSARAADAAQPGQPAVGPRPTRTGALGPGIWSNLPQVGVGADGLGPDGLRAGHRPCPEREPNSKTVGLRLRPAARLRSRAQLPLRASSTRRQCRRQPARAGPGERRGGRQPAGAAAGNRLARRQATGWRVGAARQR